MPSVCERGDWCAHGAGAPARVLVPEVQRRLANAWLQLARLEHASIGSFARFTLQLLALGAPPDLVLSAQRAAIDETRHAQLAFGLASEYAGRTLGPGPLSVDACLETTDLLEIIATVFDEGCIGETMAAVEARQALEHAREPAVRAVLETVAADEMRHAELAWRTVAWAIAAGGEAVRNRIEALVTREMIPSPVDGSPECAEDSQLLEHGIVTESLRRSRRESTLATVIVPCARQLLRIAFSGQLPARVDPEMPNQTIQV